MKRIRNESGQAVGGVLVLLGLLAIIGIFVTLNSIHSTPADKVGVVYNGGPLDKKNFRKILPPGSGVVNKGLFSSVYEYPVTVRSYIVSLNANEGDRQSADSIHAVTKDNVPVEWQANTYFKLNTDPAKLKDFQQNIGFKYAAWEQKGWDNMLSDYFRPQIENALQTATRKYTVQELYSSQESLISIQQEVAADLKTNVNSSLGDEYFCGPSYKTGTKTCPDFKFVIPKKPNIPADIVQAFNDNKTSAIAVQTAANQVLVKQQEADGIRVLAEATKNAGPAYLQKLQMDALMQAAKGGSLSLWVLPSGSNGNLMLPSPK